MARKKTYELEINTKEFKVSDILNKGSEAPLELRIASLAILKSSIAEMSGELAKWKGVYETLCNEITTSSFEKTNEKLREAYEARTGLWVSEDCSPKILIKTKDGSTMKVTVKAGVDKRFEINSALKGKAVLDLIPNEYKTVSVALNKKAIEADFDKGSLPELLRRYCSSAPIDITKLSISLGNKEEEEEEEGK